MSKVLVIDTDKRPQNPIHPAQARQLLINGKAAIFRKYPFTIILKVSRPDTVVKPLRIKIDPGSKITGLALVEEDTTLESKQEIVKKIHKHFGVTSYVTTIQNLAIKFSSDGNEEELDNQIEEVFESFDIETARDFCDQLVELEKQSNSTCEVVWACEIQHRGLAIKAKLESRSASRRSRRNRKTRYRQPPNTDWFIQGNHQPCPKQRRDGWLPPSLLSRVHNIETWVKRLCKYAPITAISQELVRFDTQIMQNPEITGKEYQQGTLAGYETREYLLEKWSRQCAYCDK